jgi:hypothetical protein
MVYDNPLNLSLDLPQTCHVLMFIPTFGKLHLCLTQISPEVLNQSTAKAHSATAGAQNAFED